MKTTLRIGAYDWNYSDEVSSKELKNDLGSCEYQLLNIQINKEITGDVKRCTIYHELLHAALVSGGLEIKNEETVVDVLANQILLFIKENKKFLKTLILELESPIPENDIKTTVELPTEPK